MVNEEGRAACSSDSGGHRTYPNHYGDVLVNHMGKQRAKCDMPLDEMSDLSLRNYQAIADALIKPVRLLEELNALQAFPITECLSA